MRFVGEIVDHSAEHPCPDLPSRLAGSVSGDAREAGRRSFLDGRVFLDEVTEAVVKADVGDGRPHRVTLTWTGTELAYSCTCKDHARTLECCEHVWATVLDAECEEGALRALPRRGEVRLAPRDRCFRSPGSESARGGDDGWKARGEILYVIDREDVLERGDLVVEVWRCGEKDRGPHSLLPLPIWGLETIHTLHERRDRKVCRYLFELALSGRCRSPFGGRDNACIVLAEEQDAILPRLLETGRLRYRERRDAALSPLGRDAGGTWDFRMEVSESEDGAHWQVTGRLVRGAGDGEDMDAGEPSLLLGGGWMLAGGRASRFADHGAFRWLSAIRRDGAFRVPKERESELLERLWSLPRHAPVAWPESLKLAEARIDPRPFLRVAGVKPGGGMAHDRDGDCLHLRAVLCFLYDGELIEYGRPEAEVADISRRRLLVRNAGQEARQREVLARHGLAPPPLELVRRGVFEPTELSLDPDHLPSAVRGLTADGWHVEAEGKLYRPRERFHVHVSSGIDWFDLEIDADFGGFPVPFPKLLKAIERGKEYVLLDDGTFGILPETWLGEYKQLLATGRLREGRLRFRRSQIVLLDRLLAAEKDASWDRDFGRARAALEGFDGIRPEPPSGDFHGELRPYQKEGLGWLRFLARAGLGGCLADDMGLGKTIQVLALLEARRSARGSGPRAGEEGSRSSFAVVPRSLVFNWISEARRFAPSLKVLAHIGAGRVKEKTHLERHDLVVTTYGTLVRDAGFLRKCRFDYAILDEAQAIKNRSSTYSKAARSLQARHRLALTGTPVENHLGELWSLFEFLDPGMLGSAARFQRLFAADEGGEGLSSLSRALRPVILRRTKREVASDLPGRVEQTIFCDLEPRERRDYDGLRDHYRARLLDDDEPSRSRVRVLEALLRLRQAACHPGLIDKSRAGEPSSKLNVLLEQLAELDEEGNKALIFSQFTTLLTILRRELDARGMDYEYLDGRTRNRRRKVERFQSDPACRLFLVSLKAGGVGLNLTAAEYVFLVDPWWNPAVEAQAIDRAHRIGQTRAVFAYRIIARGTIEERIVELQEKKRALAEEILARDKGMLSDLKREDLELLLS